MKSTNYFARKAMAVAIAAGICGSASATVTDRVHFRAAPVVLVWGADGGGAAPVVSDFVLVNTGSGTAGSDLIAANVTPVITGSMTPVPAAATTDSIYSITGATSGGAFTDAGTIGALDAADSYTAFGLDATTDLTFAAAGQSHSFYIASNAAFDINAQVAAPTTNTLTGVTGTNITWAMALATAGTDGGVTWGANAQDPTVGGGLGFTVPANLAVVANTKVYDGGRLTAASTGTILGQSVRFTATYGLNYDLSQGAGTITVPVTYTIFTP